MSLFGTKKKDSSAKPESKVVAKKASVKTTTKNSAKPVKSEKAIVISDGSASSKASVVSNIAGVIIRPRITEKSGLLSQGGVYTFEISANANKNSVSSAVKALYKVIPARVAIINNPARKVFIRGRKGVVGGIRKALVTLKKGDKIDYV